MTSRHAALNTIGAHRLVGVILSRFAEALNIAVTQPLISQTPVKIKVVVGYTPIGTSAIGHIPVNLVNVIADQLSKALGIPVAVVFISLNNVYSDAGTLVKYLAGLMGQSGLKSHSFKTAVRSLIKYVAFAVSKPQGAYTSLKGVKVRISGRLSTEPSRPRQTVQEFAIGSFSESKASMGQSASYTSINAKGTMTVKVWLSMK